MIKKKGKKTPLNLKHTRIVIIFILQNVNRVSHHASKNHLKSLFPLRYYNIELIISTIKTGDHPNLKLLNK